MAPSNKFILPHIQIPVSQCSVLTFLSKLDQPERQTKIQQKCLLLRIFFKEILTSNKLNIGTCKPSSPLNEFMCHLFRYQGDEHSTRITLKRNRSTAKLLNSKEKCIFNYSFSLSLSSPFLPNIKTIPKKKRDYKKQSTNENSVFCRQKTFICWHGNKWFPWERVGIGACCSTCRQWNME